MKTLAAHAPVDFTHRVSLVEGELCRLAGDPADALEQARRADWVTDIALAHELTARCHPDPQRARESRAAARDAYAAWGAAAKAARLA